MNLSDFRNAILDEQSLESSDTFLTTAILDRFINRAYKWAASSHPWTQTEMAEERDSADNEYYSIAENWVPDGITKLSYQDEPYKKVLMRDYLRYQDENEGNSIDKIFAEFEGKYFINPAPTEVIARAISIWGQEIPDDMSDAGDVTVFENDAEIEEAILEYANGLVLRKKAGEWFNDGVKRQEVARVKIERSWLSQQKKLADFKTHDSEMFRTPDFIEDINGRNNNDNCIGRFSI